MGRGTVPVPRATRRRPYAGVVANLSNGYVVADGETAVIAGLTQTQVTKLRSGIPWLMNVPGLKVVWPSTSAGCKPNRLMKPSLTSTIHPSTRRVSRASRKDLPKGVAGAGAT